MLERQDRRAAILLAVATVLASWLLAAKAGAAGIARTDDWAFGRVAFDLQRSGHIHLVGWGPMTLIGLVIWAQPWLWVLGDHYWVLDLGAAALFAAGLFAAHRLARRALVPALALVAVGSVVAYPGVLRDATTFMTDAPAFSLQAIALAAGVAALQARGRRRYALLAVVVLVGFWAFTVRELAVAAPIAVLAAAFSADRSTRRQIALFVGVLGVGCAGFWLWRHSLSGDQPYGGHPDAWSAANLVASAGLTGALGLAPALAWSLPRWWRPVHRLGRAIGWVAGAAVGAVLPIVAAHQGRHLWWFVGDYLQPNGMNGDKLALGFRPTVLPRAVWDLLVAVALVSLVAVGGLVGEWIARQTAERWRPRPATAIQRVLVWHLATSGAVLTVAAMWNGALFDRYLWPMILSGSVVILARPNDVVARSPIVAWGPRLGAAVLAGLAAVSLVLTVNSDVFDGARWQAGQDAVRSGIAADRVDAGFEWVGAHSSGTMHGAPATADPLVSWWSQSVGMPAVCAVVSASPIGPGVPKATRGWRPYLVAGRSTLSVYAHC